jgi:hypothetical protein
MKEQGVRQDDSEFIKVRNLLAAVQHQSNFAKQRDFHAQQQKLQQRQLLQQQTQASSILNGAHSHPGTIVLSLAMAMITLMPLSPSSNGAGCSNPRHCAADGCPPRRCQISTLRVRNP